MMEMDADALEDATEAEFDDELSSARRIDADSILDSLVPQSIDWRETVRRHPFGSVACVGLVGYLVGLDSVNWGLALLALGTAWSMPGSIER